jgi:hypothetical protein
MCSIFKASLLASLLMAPLFASPVPVREIPGRAAYSSDIPKPTKIQRETPGRAAQRNAAPCAIAPAPACQIKHMAIAPSPHQPTYYAVPQTQVQVVSPVVIYEAAPTLVIEKQPVIRPYISLTPSLISDNLKYMTLNNGSQWRIRHRDRPLIKHWRQGDLISIELGSLFSRFEYKLINHTRLESAEVNRL